MSIVGNNPITVCCDNKIALRSEVQIDFLRKLPVRMSSTLPTDSRYGVDMINPSRKGVIWQHHMLIPLMPALNRFSAYGCEHCGREVRLQFWRSVRPKERGRSYFLDLRCERRSPNRCKGKLTNYSAQMRETQHETGKLENKRARQTQFSPVPA